MTKLNITIFTAIISITALSAEAIAQASYAVEQPLDGFEMRESARPVPALAAQTEAIYQRLVRGLPTEVEHLRANSIQVHDIDGFPFFHLVFIHPTKKIDTWDLGSIVEYTEGHGWGGFSEWSTTAIGASTARSELYFTEVGVDFAGKLYRTRNKLGGPEHLNRIIALEPTDIYLEDDEGRLWSIDTGEPANEELLTWKATNYRTQAQAISSPEYLQKMEQHWGQMLDAPPTDYGDGVPRDLMHYLGENDNLDMAKVNGWISMMRDLNPFEPAFIFDEPADPKKRETLPPPSSKEVCNEEKTKTTKVSFLFWTRTVTEATARVCNMDDVAGGLAQGNWVYQKTSPDYFNHPNCAPAIGYTTGSPLGCGPASLTSLGWWWWKYKGAQWYGKTFNGEKPTYTANDVMQSKLNRTPISLRPATSTSILVNMTNPQVGGHTGNAYVAYWMDTCYLQGGLTYPGGFDYGTDRWLWQQRGWESGLTYESQWFYAGAIAVPFFNKANSIASQTRNFMGSRGIPLIALYHRGGVTMHYSVATQYHVVYGFERPTVTVKTVDDPERWTNITDGYLLAGGVFGFRR